MAIDSLVLGNPFFPFTISQSPPTSNTHNHKLSSSIFWFRRRATSREELRGGVDEREANNVRLRYGHGLSRPPPLPRFLSHLPLRRFRQRPHLHCHHPLVPNFLNPSILFLCSFFFSFSFDWNHCIFIDFVNWIAIWITLVHFLTSRKYAGTAGQYTWRWVFYVFDEMFGWDFFFFFFWFGGVLDGRQ